MNTPTSERAPGGQGAIIVLLGFLMLPLFYVLSVGPVAAAFPDSPEWIKVIYFPIVWLAHAWEPAGELFRWYLSLWGAK